MRPLTVGSSRTTFELFTELCDDVRREAQRGFGVDVRRGMSPYMLVWGVGHHQAYIAVDAGELRADGVWAVRERIMAKIAKWKRQCG